MIAAFNRWRHTRAAAADHAILCALGDGDQWFLFRLCDRAGMGTGRVSRSLSRLYANGWVEYGRETPGMVYPLPLSGRRWYRIAVAGRDRLPTEEQR